MKKQYVKPTLSVTVFNLKDVIMTSPIENYSSSVIDGGDWDDWGNGGNSLNNELG